MRLRSLFPALILVLVSGTSGAQDLGKGDRLRQEYLSETVRRGLPLAGDRDLSLVPYWPSVDRAWADAASLEPGADTDLVGAWVSAQEGDRPEALRILKAGWPRPPLVRFSPRAWGLALFEMWEPQASGPEWIRAWVGWEAKAYSSAALVRGLEVLEQSDPSAVEPLLRQALALYPEDRRFLPLVSRHPQTVRDAAGLLARDRTLTGGFSAPALASLLDRNPGSRDLLVRAGYAPAVLDGVQARDYGRWAADPAQAREVPADGLWTWDADRDGRSESRLVFRGGQLVSWTRAAADGGLWSLFFSAGQPVRVTETREGATWTLSYEAYPWVRTLEYRWSGQTTVYRFAPLAQALPLGPEGRFQAPGPRWPASLGELTVPLDPRVLAQASASVETWEAGIRTRTVYLASGEVWLAVEDTDQDGRDDSWSYFRSGRLASVYRDPEGRGQAGLRELYARGELVQVQAQAPSGTGTAFVLFPQSGTQLWDPKGDRRPLDRVFVWTGGDRLQALVFSGTRLPWETMPPWEPRP